jgi:hypothetical protein
MIELSVQEVMGLLPETARARLSAFAAGIKKPPQGRSDESVGVKKPAGAGDGKAYIMILRQLAELLKYY